MNAEHIPTNKPGHIPSCVNHPEVRDNTQNYAINQSTGLLQHTAWTTKWLKGCPHRKSGGNALLWGWNCDQCKWRDYV